MRRRENKLIGPPKRKPEVSGNYSIQIGKREKRKDDPHSGKERPNYSKSIPGIKKRRLIPESSSEEDPFMDYSDSSADEQQAEKHHKTEELIQSAEGGAGQGEKKSSATKRDSGREPGRLNPGNFNELEPINISLLGQERESIMGRNQEIISLDSLDYRLRLAIFYDYTPDEMIWGYSVSSKLDLAKVAVRDQKESFLDSSTPEHQVVLQN